MDFNLSSEQQLVVETARAYAREHLLPRARERDEKEIFPEEELRALGRLGLLGVNVPESLGGSGAGVVAYALALSNRCGRCLCVGGHGRDQHGC